MIGDNSQNRQVRTFAGDLNMLPCDIYPLLFPFGWRWLDANEVIYHLYYTNVKSKTPLGEH